jgi:hypothetical protein
MGKKGDSWGEIGENFARCAWRANVLSRANPTTHMTMGHNGTFGGPTVWCSGTNKHKNRPQQKHNHTDNMKRSATEPTGG